MDVLVIDDTKNIRLLLTKCLSYEGYHVTTAEGGKEAINLLSKNHFDLIFLDVRMPEISGTEVLRHLREMNVSTPVIMITAFGTVKNAVECTQLGAVAYLQKPFTENKIKQVLAEVIQLKPEPIGPDDLLRQAEEQIICGRYGEAETYLKNALPTHHLEPRIYMLFAQVYEGLGQKSEAEKCQSIAKSLLKFK